MKKLLNFMQNTKVKSGIFLPFLFILYFFICAQNYVQAVSSDISNSVFRLHVIANSDTAEDQNLKYKVRDSLLNYMNSLCANITSKEEAILMVENHKEDFKNIALNVIHSEGFNYDVNIEIGNFSFPTKTYGDISLPSGFYDALKVEIGKGAGQNWWCVMFPSLCVPAAAETIEECGVFSDEEIEMLKNPESYECRFYILELIDKLKNYLQSEKSIAENENL